MNNHNIIDYMMKFTDAFIKHESDNKYQREAICNSVQLEYIMLPPQPEDLLVGRKREMPIGFLPQTSNDRVGYYCVEEALENMKSNASEDDIKQLEFLLNYWRGKTTNEKIIASYTSKQLECFTMGDMNTESGTAFPLYRMSGAQMDPEKLLKYGINGLIEDAKRREASNPAFYQGICLALDSLSKLCIHYGDFVKNMVNGRKPLEMQILMAENLYYISENPPKTFWQAMQLSHLFYIVSGTFNYGRMDEYLGEFYCHDIDAGIINEDFALCLVKNLWQLIIDRATITDGRIVLGGKDRRNIEEADRFALVAIRASRELKDVLPQLTLRCYDGMNLKVYEAAIEAIGNGGTYPMLYNDEVNIPAVAKAFSVSPEVAVKYLPFGCGEYILYNQSFGTPSGAINVLHCLNELLYGNDGKLIDYPDFESLYQRYMCKLEEIILLLAQQEKLEYEVCAEEAPYLYFSILFDHCMERGKPVFEGGIAHLGGTLETYGNTNVFDSLCAIKTLIYDKQILSAIELQNALKNNFKGYDNIRKLLLSAPKYGNDDSVADEIAVRFHADLCKIIRSCSKKVGLDSYLAVIINNSMNTTFGLTTGASADGRMANTYMANANNPTGGMDKNGITAMLNSLVKLSPDYHAGAVQNMRFSGEMFTNLLEKTKNLLEVYFLRGGTQTMITVVNRNDLESAMRCPEEYKNLIVRVGGFSARFVELNHEVQKELLSRTIY